MKVLNSRTCRPTSITIILKNWFLRLFKIDIPEKKMRFKGKVVVVTGSTTGIGQCCALRYLEEGAFVTIHGQNPEKMDKMIQLLKDKRISASSYHYVLGPIQEESTRKKLVDETVRKFGKVDILVNNAGTTNHNDKLYEPNGLENFDHVFSINVRSLFAMTHLIAPELAKTKGNVVNVSSAASTMVSAGFAPYCMSKVAVDHFSRNAAVFPGFVWTHISEHYGVPHSKMPGFFDSYIQNCVPLKRIGQVDEVASSILFLSSSEASFITGAQLFIDGGLSVSGNPINPDV
ncbi:hypothetical protein M3Y97_01069400 [Aphelenchoides bicaudatus]|nr:hypothetical protein M3Y97_01069400 [Aphelenchoides bicaudatus]